MRTAAPPHTPGLTRNVIRNNGNMTTPELPGWTHGAMDIHTAPMAKIVREFLDS